MSTYNDASLIYYPSGYKASKAYSLKPTDGSGDLTFTRASSATRVNEQGLIETAGVISPTELVVNGDFATDTNWTKQAGWSIGGGVATCNGSSGSIYQTGVVEIGKYYFCQFDVINLTSGSVAINVGGNTSGQLRTSIGTYSETLYVVSGSNNRAYILSQSFNGSIDNVSVKELITNNVPRIDYTGGGCGKLLLEGQRTNSLLQSNTFNTTWINQLGGGTITGGQINALSEIDDAWKLTKDASAGRSIRQAISLSSSTYAYSAFLKAGTLANAAMRVDTSSGARFMNLDLSIGTISSTSGTIVSTSIEDYGNGWYRCTMVVAESITNVHVYVGEFSGTTAGDIYCQRTQLEAGSYPTSYISTTTTAVTRVVDGFSVSSLFSKGIVGVNGSLFVDINTANISNFLFTTFNTLSQRSGVIRFTSASNTFFIGNVEGGSGSTQITLGSLPPRAKLLFRKNGTTYTLFYNGVKASTDITAPAQTWDKLEVESGFAPNMTVNSVMLFNSALSDAEAIALTTI